MVTTMEEKRDPFNIKLLKLEPAQLRLLKPITSLDRFEGSGSSNFHEKGLFSTEIFGRVGDDVRDKTFAYIPLKTSILHPIVYQRLERLKRLYIGILTGKEFGVWDEEKKDFFLSDELEGQTGYQFFMSHWNELVFAQGDSEIRKQRVAMINKFRDQSVLENVLVMPAGLRDAEVDSLGRTREGEINEHYHRLVQISNTIAKSTKSDSGALDTPRAALQKAFNMVYTTIESMLSGKRGFLQDKWGSRNIQDGTRNVITSMDISAPDLNAENYPGPDDTVMGLWQVSRGSLPITIARLRDNILSDVFGDVEGNVSLIDPKTLVPEFVQVSPQTYDRWTTTDGLGKVVDMQSMVGIRAKPVMVEGRYLMLVYKPKGEMVFKLFRDIRELPEGASKKDVHPLTYEEMIYLSNYRGWNDLRVISTRYPVAGEGSTYPSKVFVRTTVKTEARVELDMTWEPMDADENTAQVYPIFDPESYIDSSMVHPYRLAGLGGDYDGDTVSNNIVYTQEAKEEIDKYLNSRSAHVDPAGGMRASAHIDTTALVMHNMTG